MLNKTLKYIPKKIKWLAFDLLESLAKQGNTKAHNLACKFLPYQKPFTSAAEAGGGTLQNSSERIEL